MAHGRCRRRGRKERAHRALDTPQTDVPTAPTSRFVIGLAKAWGMSIESVCYEFTR